MSIHRFKCVFLKLFTCFVKDIVFYYLKKCNFFTSPGDISLSVGCRSDRNASLFTIAQPSAKVDRRDRQST